MELTPCVPGFLVSAGGLRVLGEQGALWTLGPG